MIHIDLFCKLIKYFDTRFESFLVVKNITLKLDEKVDFVNGFTFQASKKWKVDNQ
jgi:hypothetical protein